MQPQIAQPGEKFTGQTCPVKERLRDRFSCPAICPVTVPCLSRKTDNPLITLHDFLRDTYGTLFRRPSNGTTGHNSPSLDGEVSRREGFNSKRRQIKRSNP